MIDIPTMVTIVSVGLAIGTFFIGRVSAGKESGREAGSLQTDIKYIKASIDRIEKQLDRDIGRLEGRIEQIALQSQKAKSVADEALQSAKSAHKRMDAVKVGHCERG